jgi:hypothetical protein
MEFLKIRLILIRIIKGLCKEVRSDLVDLKAAIELLWLIVVVAIIV